MEKYLHGRDDAKWWKNVSEGARSHEQQHDLERRKRACCAAPHLRCCREKRRPGRCRATAPAREAARALRGGGGWQGRGRHGGCRGCRLAGRGCLGRGGDPLRPRRAGWSHRGAAGGASGAGRGQRAGLHPHPAGGAGPGGRRPGGGAHFRRRLVAAHAARAGHDTGRQAGAQPHPAGQRRHHQRDERAAPPALGHQGRTAGAGCAAGAAMHPYHLRRAGRRSGRHRIRAHHCRPSHAGRGPSHRGPLPDGTACRRTGHPGHADDTGRAASPRRGEDHCCADDGAESGR